VICSQTLKADTTYDMCGRRRNRNTHIKTPDPQPYKSFPPTPPCESIDLKGCGDYPPATL